MLWHDGGYTLERSYFLFELYHLIFMLSLHINLHKLIYFREKHE